MNEPGGNYLIQISEGAQGVKETLAIMRRIVLDARRNPSLIELARLRVSGVLAKDYLSEIAALFAFVRSSVRYVQDPRDVELLATPERTLAMGSGDCDEMATLLASLLEAVGFKTRFKAVGFAPGDLSHVYVQVRFDSDARGINWISLDPTEPYPMGWEPPNIREQFIVNI